MAFQASSMDSPRPIYYEQHQDGACSLFAGGHSEYFDAYDQLESYCAANYTHPYEIILVDLSNWDELYQSGCFDCD